jgi:pilus assembly protein CpaF
MITGPARDGTVNGEFRATGLRPSFLEQLLLNGAEIPEGVFHPGVRL